MSNRPKLISIVIPVHNEAANLEWFFRELTKYTDDTIAGYDFEYLFVDDGSHDNSLYLIKRLAENEKNVKYISLSKNYGKEAATSAGLNYSLGDAAIMIDGDGQHPCEVIEQFVVEWEKGADVVVGVRSSNQKEGAIKRYGSKLFYKILGFLDDSGITPAATDFRLIDRRVLNEFNKLTEHNRITRGLIDWLGFNQKYIEFNAAARKHGKATYSHTKLLKLAINSFVSHSTKPLKIIGLLGVVVTFFSGILGLFVLIEQWVLSDPLGLAFTGTALLAVFLSFLTGITLTCQGLLALYVETIHSETQNRPLYIVAETNAKT